MRTLSSGVSRFGGRGLLVSLGRGGGGGGSGISRFGGRGLLVSLGRGGGVVVVLVGLGVISQFRGGWLSASLAGGGGGGGNGISRFGGWG